MGNMGKFPWTQGHHKQGSDKQHFLPTDWFNKSTTEPSRHALNELVKEHVATDPDGTTSFRSGTATSGRSHHVKSPSDRSAEIKSRPQSRQSILEDAPSSPTRQEPVSRSLFSKGSRIIRRKTSRLTLLPSQIEEVHSVGHRRDLDASKLELAAQLLSLSPKRKSLHSITDVLSNKPRYPNQTQHLRAIRLPACHPYRPRSIPEPEQVQWD